MEFVFSNKSIVIITPLIILLVGSLYSSSSVFGTNRSQIVIPAVEQIIPLDGNVDENKWENSYKISFPEAGKKGQNVTIYFQYNPSKKTLVGAFVIPDDSPASNVREFDAIRFIFDVGTKLSNDTKQSVIHDIALYRYGEIIYRIGNDIKSRSNVSPVKLQLPFERIEFKTNSNSDGWTGQFRIYLRTEPTFYKFAIQQQNDWTGKQGNISIFPSSKTNLSDPNTWGSIAFKATSAPTPTPTSAPTPTPTSAPTPTPTSAPTPTPTSAPTPTPTSAPTPTPPPLTVFIKNVDGLTVTIDGRQSPEIVRIRCYWGDGEQSTCNFNPDFKHTYDKPNTYEISVFGFNEFDKQIAESEPISVSVNTVNQGPANDRNPLMEPAVLAAIVTTIGGIAGALIALKKRRGGS
jgi:hypothetical protein